MKISSKLLAGSWRCYALLMLAALISPRAWAETGYRQLELAVDVLLFGRYLEAVGSSAISCKSLAIDEKEWSLVKATEKNTISSLLVGDGKILLRNEAYDFSIEFFPSCSPQGVRWRCVYKPENLWRKIFSSSPCSNWEKVVQR